MPLPVVRIDDEVDMPASLEVGDLSPVFFFLVFRDVSDNSISIIQRAQRYGRDAHAADQQPPEPERCQRLDPERLAWEIGRVPIGSQHCLAHFERRTLDEEGGHLFRRYPSLAGAERVAGGAATATMAGLNARPFLI